MHPSILVLITALCVSTTASADTDVASTNLFPAESARVLDDARTGPFLASVAQHLSQDPERHLRIVVHADERIGTMDNTVIGDLRARAIVRALQKLGARKKQLTSESVGHSGIDRTPETSRIVFDFDDDAYIAWPGEK